MRVCSQCESEYQEEFKFCPECGRAFGGEEAISLKQKLDQHLLNLVQDARQEERQGQMIKSQGLGANIGGRIYGASTEL